MSGLLVTAVSGGNVAVHCTISTVADVVHVEAVGGGRVLVDIGADEPVQIMLTGPGHVLADVLFDALAAVLEHLESTDA